MPEAEFVCPHCSAPFPARFASQGQTVICPGCRQASPAWRLTPADAPGADATRPLECPAVLALAQGPAEPGCPPAYYCQQMQRFANDRSIRRILRPHGGGSIFFGIVAVLAGLASLEASALNGILALIGLMLLVEGAWILAAPSVEGLKIDGIAIIIVGVWNIVITAADLFTKGPDSWSFFLLLGIWQISLGFKSFRLYRRFSALPVEKPSPGDAQALEETVQAIVRAKPSLEPHIVEFQARADSPLQRWKAGLYEGLAIFVELSGQDLVFALKADAEITPEPGGRNRNVQQAAFRLNDRRLAGTLKPEYYERYLAWKAAA